MHLGREDIVHLIVKQVAPLLAHVDELAYLVIFFFNCQRQSFLPCSSLRAILGLGVPRDSGAVAHRAPQRSYPQQDKEDYGFPRVRNFAPRCCPSYDLAGPVAPMPTEPLQLLRCKWAPARFRRNQAKLHGAAIIVNCFVTFWLRAYRPTVGDRTEACQDWRGIDAAPV